MTFCDMRDCTGEATHFIMACKEVKGRFCHRHALSLLEANRIHSIGKYPYWTGNGKLTDFAQKHKI